MTNFINSWIYNTDCEDNALILPPACEGQPQEVINDALQSCSLLLDIGGNIMLVYRVSQ